MRSTRRSFLRLLGIGAVATTAGAIACSKMQAVVRNDIIKVDNISMRQDGRKYRYVQVNRTVKEGEFVYQNDILQGVVTRDIGASARTWCWIQTYGLCKCYRLQARDVEGTTL